MGPAAYLDRFCFRDNDGGGDGAGDADADGSCVAYLGLGFQTGDGKEENA